MEEELLDTASDSQSQAPILEIGDQPSREFLELFNNTNSAISGELIEKAWKQYDTLGQQIVLEGNQQVWMACSFFTTVWQATPIGRQELVCHYSLSKLLQLCQVSVLEFFDKLNKWADMILASRRMLDFISRIQSNLAVSAVIFKKFLPIFRHVFSQVSPPVTTRQTPQKRSHYANPLQKLSSAALFEFTWLFYITLKKQLPSSHDDLLNSFHLLLCTIDYIYTALEKADQHKHLRPAFVKSLTLDDEQQSPLVLLCEKFEGVMLDAKHLRTHWLMPQLNKLAMEESIIGHSNSDGGLLVAFEDNRTALEKLYEKRMQARGEIDERIFLSQILPNMQLMFNGELDESAVRILHEFGENGQRIDTELLMKVSMQNCMEKLRVGKKTGRIKPPTTGKCYVITPETVCPNTAFCAEMELADKMDQLLVRYQQSGETVLDFYFDQCQENPRNFVAEQLASFTQKFLAKVDEDMIEKGADFDADFERNIPKSIGEIETLFYCLLQKVVTYDRECAAGKGLELTVDLGTIFQNVDFLASIYISAAELIIWVRRSKRKFPWAGELFKDSVTPINFYKIFELVVRAETNLSVEMVRHLNQMEECVLEELAWSSASPLWALLKNSLAVEQFGEKSPVPGSQILTRIHGQNQRYADLPLSTIVFFKKVYHLAAIRFMDLCERVRIMDDLTRQKIWTLFEHAFRTKTSLLRNRHLDQLLMCSVYIMAKVCNLGISFQDIMYHYRHQPQASSRVYRQVLMDNDPDSQTGEGTPAQKEYADLIKFYNRIFVAQVEDHVKLLHPSGPDSKENLVPLSPMPKIPLNPLSPRKLINDRINVVSMGQYAQTISQTISQHRTAAPPGLGRRYDFHKSPSKELRSINTMVRGGGDVTIATTSSSIPRHYASSNEQMFR